MAIFNPSPDPTNDPNYLGSSRGYSDVKANTSIGTLLSNLGEITGAAAKAADTEIQEKIRREAYDQIDALNREHGGYMPPDQIPGIAGKGSRGAKYAQVTGAGLPVDDTLGMDSVPGAVGRRLDGLKKLSKAYNAGELSNSYYESQFTAIVSNLRAQYPGYRKQIDDITADIRGTPAANSLRKSLLTDMNSMAAAANAAGKNDEAWYAKENQWLHMLHPDKPKSWFIENRPQMEIAVGQLQAKKQSLEVQDLELRHATNVDTHTRNRAKTVYSQHVMFEVSAFMTGTMNVLGERLQQFESRVDTTLRKGDKAKPEEIEALKRDFVLIKGELSQRIDKATMGTAAFSLIEANDRNAIKDNAMKMLDVLEQKIGAKDWTLAGTAGRLVKHQTDTDVLTATRNRPVLRDLKVLEQTVGQSAMGTAIQTLNVLPELSRAIAERQLLNISDKADTKPPPSLTQVLEAHKRPDDIGEVPPGTVKKITDAIHTITKHEDPAVASRAVKSLFGDLEYFARVPGTQKLQIYTRLGNPEFTKTMEKLKSSNPEAWNTYRVWMEEAFKGVFKQAADDFQSAVQFNQYDTAFQPKSFQFRVETKPEVLRVQRMRGQVLSGQDPAQGYADRLNQGLTLLKPVLEAQYGPDAQAKLVDILGRMGVDFSTAGSRGTVLEELGKKIYDTLPGITFDERHPTPKKEEGAVPAGKLAPQRLSSNETLLDTQFLEGIVDSVKINPEAWDNFIKNARQSTNVEDLRGEDTETPAIRELLREALKKAFEQRTITGYKDAVERKFREEGGIDRVQTGWTTDPETGEVKPMIMEINYPGRRKQK